MSNERLPSRLWRDNLRRFSSSESATGGDDGKRPSKREVMERIRRCIEKVCDISTVTRCEHGQWKFESESVCFARNRKTPRKAPSSRELQLVDISKLGLNSKIRKFSYSFICGKGYSPPFGGRIAFCLQSEAPSSRELSSAARLKESVPI